MLTKTLRKIRKFLAEEDGPTAVEYVFMTALIVIVCLVSINTIGQMTGQSFDSSSAAIQGALSD